jgi:predicted aspartyl protease
LNINSIILHYGNKPLAVITDAQVQEVEALAALKATKPESYKVQALWDTGAQMCAISKELVEEMGLTVAGKIDAGGFGGNKKDTPFYYVDLTLPDEYHLNHVAAIEYEAMSSHNFIIGMSIITMGDFSLTREDKGIKFHFTFDK